jgi:hypothetical protein
MTKEAIQKFGAIYQFGVDYMENFNDDAAAFLAAYRQNENTIKANGYSRAWDNWKEDNQNLIIRLYDALNAANKIPTAS